MGGETVDDEAYADLTGPRTPRGPDEKELRAEAWAATFGRLAKVALVAALALALVFGAYNAYQGRETVSQIRETQVGNRATLQQAKNAAVSSKRTADRIEDCTTPGGACFERSQSTTSGAIAGISTVTVRATACLAVILRQFPSNTVVHVDDVASQISKCIKSSTVTVPPTSVPNGVNSSGRRSTGTSAGTSSTRPKGPRRTNPAAPTPTAPSRSGTPSPPLPCQLLPQLCDLTVPLPTLLP